MSPNHLDHGDGVASLISARLLRMFSAWDFSLNDISLTPVLDALHVLGWEYQHRWVEHPDNFEWGRTYTYGIGSWGAEDYERYFLHIPGEVMIEPSSLNFSQVEEAIESIANSNMSILLFSWKTTHTARPFRSMQRRYQKCNVDVDFKPWIDVEEFHTALHAEAHLAIEERWRSRGLAAKLLNLD
jgi:hypothetical protein